MVDSSCNIEDVSGGSCIDNSGNDIGNDSGNDNGNSNIIIVPCPHCNGSVLIMRNEINCSIFRHGIYKHNKQQMNPHASERECTRARMDGLIYGCGKPFRLQGALTGKYTAVVCDYI